MGLFEFILPEVAEAEHLKTISRQMRHMSVQRSSSRAESRRSADIEEDLGVVSLILLSLVKKLIEKGVITREELFSHIKELDALDGIKDGKLDINVFRGVMGLPKEEKPKPTPPAPKRRRRR